MTAEKLIAELRTMAMADISDYVDIIDGNAVVKDLKSIPPRKRRAVASLKNGAGNRGAEIKLYDRTKAIELLARFLGILDGSADSEARTLDRLDEVIGLICGEITEEGGGD